MHSTLVCAALLCVSCAATLNETDENVEEIAQPELDECPAGPNQSPISLPLTPGSTALDKLTFDYQMSHVAVSNTGKTVQYSYDAGSGVSIGSARYELVQFHFHAHSEHALAGVLMPMELHLVHKDASGRLLVVGIFIAEGEHNPTLDLAAWPMLPLAAAGALDLPTHLFTAADFVPGGPSYRYTGSLTAPPCTGDVSWILYQRPITLDAAQIETFTRLYAHNARGLQSFGDRALSFGE